MKRNLGVHLAIGAAFGVVGSIFGALLAPDEGVYIHVSSFLCRGPVIGLVAGLLFGLVIYKKYSDEVFQKMSTYVINAGFSFFFSFALSYMFPPIFYSTLILIFGPQ